MFNKYGTAEEVDTAATGIKEDPTKVKIDKYGVAEEEYVTDEHLKAYEKFVVDVQAKFNLKTKEEAQEKAQQLIKDYQEKENKARKDREF